MNSKQCPKCSACSPDNAASCRDCGYQWPTPISDADLIAEADRNYDLGRKHVKGELAPPLAALERLYKSCAGLRLRCEMHAPQIKGFSDWEENTKAMQAAENLLPTPSLTTP